MTLGGQVTDTATLSGATNPTGTITFTLFGPDDATCAGTAAFTSTKTVNGNGTYVSDHFSRPRAGTYRWVAVYSGDANNATVTCPATRPRIVIVIRPPRPRSPTQASPTVPLGDPVTDTATLAGGNNPTGTITFTALRPERRHLLGHPVFTNTETVNGQRLLRLRRVHPDGARHLPLDRQLRRRREQYRDSPPLQRSGTVGRRLAAGPGHHLDPGVGDVTVGEPINDVATLSGGFNPTGTITFTLFGPDNPTCTGAPIFTSHL